MLEQEKNKFKVALLMALLVPLLACAQEDGEDKRKPNPDEKKYQPFSIRFDMDGNPVLLDKDGKFIRPEVLPFPIKATSIERVDSIVIVQATGSHFKVIKANNKEYKIPLPH